MMRQWLKVVSVGLSIVLGGYLMGGTVPAVMAATEPATVTSSSAVKASSDLNQVSEATDLATSTSSAASHSSAEPSAETSSSSSQESSKATETSSSTKPARTRMSRALAATESSVTTADTEIKATDTSGTLGTVHWTYENRTLTLSGGSFENSLNYYQNDKGGQSPWLALPTIQKIVINGQITAPAGSSYAFLFADLRSVSTITNSNYINFSGIVSVQNMFWMDAALTSLDFAQADMSSVRDSSGMFNNCNHLGNLDVSNWDMSSATVLFFMFMNCNDLTYLDLSNWQVPVDANIKSMLAGTTDLSHLKLGANSRIASTGIPSVPNDGTYNGYWYTPGKADQYSSTDLMAKYDGATMAGDYYWSKGAQVLVKYVDQANNEIADQQVMTGTDGTSYTTSAATVPHFTLIKTPDNAKGTYVANQVITVTYVYAGALELDATLQGLDFGSNPISAFNQTYPLQTKTGKLEVTNYGSGSWQLSAQLSTPFTGEKSGQPLRSNLQYQSATGTQTVITQASTPIITKTTDPKATVDVAANWGDGTGEGLYLEVPGGSAMADNYQATLTWTVELTPTN
ncbi:MucBP domain-containing protein [Lactiplantibacillus modestisalitolerans]|uniref:MucBP domain-containing protein n=1 Tax=Lactiplantibacillus modestisalitolerans TaxID=1457219 RepID=A0ABV5WS35_9LACO|nr:MucBP domain-containing protein [Lactiplantibacillus modestisalitolerans]